ncbi:OprD family outer membrane porin [Acinetobacter baumannii]|uniref:OprD family outer membrane porin n=1 Tax=Acinetobacter baumannii TaxID=470 RepID=UPI00045059D2|nr:OprD family outer membrane porin [Acinetobacter baumannii]EXR23114.1 benF-like porin [Acinetobacter baumannii 1295549]EXR89413.1 benF-like porin [Acinetobacter baumannii 277047]EXS37899.1 benF-like porin [Acinetobacter baumannii 426863]
MIENILNKRISYLRYLAVLGGILFHNSVYADSKNTFIEDASAEIKLRNFYMNRDYQKNRVRDTGEAWTQSFIADFKSGYTPGKIGVGLDFLGLYSFKIRGEDNEIGTQLLPVKENNIQEDDFGRLAIAVKGKVSNTELKVGEWSPVLPILRSDDGRSLPQTFEGWQLTSSEFKNLKVHLGQFYKNSPRDSERMKDMYLTSRSSANSDQFNFIGLDYSFNEKNDQISIWYSQLKDIYQQNYFQYTKSIPIDSMNLKWNVGYLYGTEHGDAKAGQLDNQALYSTLSLANKYQKVSFSAQQMMGKDEFLRVNGTSGFTLANDSFTSSYDNPKESSWQIRHDFNFGKFNLPALNLMNRYIYGNGIENSQTKDGREHGFETEISYTIKTGWLKSLSIKARHSEIRRNWGNTNSFNDNRLILSYTIPVFN